MTDIQRLAKHFSSDSPAIGITTGTVIEVSPLKVRLAANIIAEYPNLYYIAGMTFNAGDHVVVDVSEDNQRYYILGKVVKA